MARSSSSPIPRCASPTWRSTRARDRVIAVLEDQRESALLPRNLLCAVSLTDGTLTELAAGHDFTSDPRLSPDGGRLAFLTWDFPQMPWDGTDLWVAPVTADGSLGPAVHVAGGTTESIVQPRWAPDGSLVFVSDRSGWWNLYRWRPDIETAEPLAPMDAEFAGPQWVFGLSDFDIDADGTIVATASAPGGTRLLRLRDGEPPRDLEIDADAIAYVRVRDGIVTCRRRLLDPADGRHPARPGRRTTGAPARERPARRRSGVPVGATARRLPHLGWPDRLRVVLPASEPGRRGAGE